MCLERLEKERQCKKISPPLAFNCTLVCFDPITASGYRLIPRNLLHVQCPQYRACTT